MEVKFGETLEKPLRKAGEREQQNKTWLGRKVNDGLVEE